MEEVVSLISNVGFPIACVVAMFWQLQKIEDQHHTEMEKMTEVIQANTNAIIELTAKLDKE